MTQLINTYKDAPPKNISTNLSDYLQAIKHHSDQLRAIAKNLGSLEAIEDDIRYVEVWLNTYADQKLGGASNAGSKN